MRKRNSNGSGSITAYGYKQIRVNGKKIYEHRHVMEQFIGRNLFPDENAHHKNGDKLDNRIENLELWSSAQPPGQRIEDKLQRAYEIIKRYGDLTWD